MVTLEHPGHYRNGALLVGANLLGAGAEPFRAPVLVRRRKIVALGLGAERMARRVGASVLELDGYSLAPGLIDLHTHGAVGVDFVRATREEFSRSMDHYLAHGVTGLLVSLYPSSWKESLKVLERISTYLRQGVGRGVAVGIHLEGPFLSPRKPGALPKRNFRACSKRDARRLLQAANGCLKTVTIAPELPGARELVSFFRRHGVVPSFGHSDAEYHLTRQSISWGLKYATHLFNAMNGLHHRSPGAVGALLEDPKVTVEVISDGYHVEAPVLRLVNRIKPPSRVVLVSDSIHPCGLRDGAYSFAGSKVILRDGRVTLADGTLAGSALSLDRALQVQARQAGVPLRDAILYSTANPARLVGLRRYRGSIAPAKRADLVLLDRHLRVRATWLAGELVYSASAALRRRLLGS